MREFKPRFHKKERVKLDNPPTGLVLSRGVGEVICIGEDVLVTVTHISSDGRKVRLCITAPRDVEVDRLEIREDKRKNPH